MPVNLAAVELKLLVVFDALLVEGNVTRAAHRVGLSQPAVSNALNRLRHLMKDRLFVRTGGGMQPTPRAVELALPIQSALRQLEEALEPACFRPEDAEWTFNLAVSDHASVVMLPLLMEHIAKVAPGVKLTAMSKRNAEVPALLDANEIDIALGIIPELPKRFSRMHLFDDRYVCMMRRGHPLAGRPISLEEFTAAEHLSVKPGSHEESRADRILAREGIRRRTTTTVHQFLAAPAIVARSDMVVLVFERMTRIFDSTGFYFCPVPVRNVQVAASAVWSRVHSGHAAHRWMRRQIAIACRRLADEEDADLRAAFRSAA